MDPPERERYFRNQPRRVPLGFAEYAGDKQFATTLARGIELLRCFTADATELSNADLAQRSGLPRPTVSRLTYTLTVLGYLRHNPRSGRYEPGAALISATYPLMASLTVRQRARPLMDALATATGGQVSLGMRDRQSIVLIETSRAPGAEPADGPVADVGLSLPIAGTAIGRAFLAGCDAALREVLFNEIRVKAPGDWAQFEAGMRGALAEHGRRGYCTVDGDLVADILAIGACVRTARAGEPLVINCAFLRGNLPAGAGAAWLHREVGPRLKALVQRLSHGGP